MGGVGNQFAAEFVWGGRELDVDPWIIAGASPAGFLAIRTVVVRVYKPTYNWGVLGGLCATFPSPGSILMPTTSFRLTHIIYKFQSSFRICRISGISSPFRSS